MGPRPSDTQSELLTAWDVGQCRIHRLADSCERPLDGRFTVHGPLECVLQAVVHHIGSPHRGQQYVAFIRFLPVWAECGKRASNPGFYQNGLGYWRMPNTPNTQACRQLNAHASVSADSPCMAHDRERALSGGAPHRLGTPRGTPYITFVRDTDDK